MARLQTDKMWCTILHPVAGSSKSLKGMTDIVVNDVEDKQEFSDRAMDGSRVVISNKDTNATIEITVLVGSSWDIFLNRCTLYQDTISPLTWRDERVDKLIRGGAGNLSGVNKPSLTGSETTVTYTLMATEYADIG